MTQMISINSPEFTREAFVAAWADDETLTAAEVQDCADAQYAWLVISAGEAEGMRGWSYTGDGFTGPWRSNDVLEAVAQLMTDSIDYVVASLDEIRNGATTDGDADLLPSV